MYRSRDCVRLTHWETVTRDIRGAWSEFPIVGPLVEVQGHHKFPCWYVHPRAMSNTKGREGMENAHGIRIAPANDSYALSLNSIPPNSSSRLDSIASCSG